jgi:hypothetical protein
MNIFFDDGILRFLSRASSQSQLVGNNFPANSEVAAGAPAVLALAGQAQEAAR